MALALAIGCAKHIQTRTVPQFDSGVTGTVYINDNGDRIADYALLDMDPEDGRFKVTIDDDALLSLGRFGDN